MRVLAIEDQPAFVKLVSSHLAKHGFLVDAAASLADALATLSATRYDAILLDLVLPDGNGAQLVDRLRREGSTVPAIVISARGLIAERIGLLEAGADDYLVKPFDLEELVARIRAVTRRGNPDEEQRLAFGNL